MGTTPAGSGSERLLGIGAAAERAGVSQRALRYYQQIGLLTPYGCTPGGLHMDARISRTRALLDQPVSLSAGAPRARTHEP